MNSCYNCEAPSTNTCALCEREYCLIHRAALRVDAPPLSVTISSCAFCSLRVSMHGRPVVFPVDEALKDTLIERATAYAKSMLAELAIIGDPIRAMSGVSVTMGYMPSFVSNQFSNQVSSAMLPSTYPLPPSDDDDDDDDDE